MIINWLIANNFFLLIKSANLANLYEKRKINKSNEEINDE